MKLSSNNRIMLLIPFLGILAAVLFGSLPQGSAQAKTPSTRIAFSVPDREASAPQVYAHADAPEQHISRPRKFHCRGRAIPPAFGLGSAVLISVRDARHTGRYVLRHADTGDEVPTSSQYAYLFLLTPF